MKNSDISARLECAVGDLRQSEQIRERLTAENEALHQRLNAADEEIDRFRNQPAQQHQGEPVAWRYRTHAGGLWYLSSSEHNARMFENAEKGSRVEPLYTHADPGEVERLRAEAGQHKLAMDAACGEIEALRAKLAERDALRVKAIADVEYIQKECGGDVPPGYIGCLVDDLHDLLSDSAEPSAPVERDERAAFDAWFKEHSKDWPFPSESIKCIARDNDWLVWQARAALEKKS